MVTGWVMAGRADAGWMVCTPPPPMSKAIALAPVAALATRIAWRSDPGPASAVLVTRKVDRLRRSSSASSRRRAGFRTPDPRCWQLSDSCFRKRRRDQGSIILILLGIVQTAVHFARDRSLYFMSIQGQVSLRLAHLGFRKARPSDLKALK